MIFRFFSFISYGMMVAVSLKDYFFKFSILLKTTFQGYLAQVLSFHYQHAVFAIDACSHHGRVTDARAEQIKKYYASQIRKSVYDSFLFCFLVAVVPS